MKLRKTKEAKKVDLTEVVDQMTDNFEDDLLEETREIEEIVNEEPKKEVKKELKLVPRKDLNKTKEEKDMSKSKRRFKFKFDMSIIIFIFILVVIGGLVLFLTIGNGGNKSFTYDSGTVSFGTTAQTVNITFAAGASVTFTTSTGGAFLQRIVVS